MSLGRPSLLNSGDGIVSCVERPFLKMDSLQQKKKSKPKLPPVAKSASYKTKMCRNYMLYGSCPYGRVCQFAHGRRELEEYRLVVYWKQLGTHLFFVMSISSIRVSFILFHNTASHNE